MRADPAVAGSPFDLPGLESLTGEQGSRGAGDPEDRRGAHPRFRALVDEGPEAVEQSIREYIKQAEPEDVAENPRAWWQTALEVLDVPRNAVANLVGSIAGVEGSSKESFAGMRKIYGADFLQKMGWQPDSTIGKVGQFLTGLTLDFLSDPISWVTLGAGSLKTAATGAAGATQRGIRIGTRAIRETPIGHVVAGPAIVGPMLAGATARLGGSIARKTLGQIPVVGKVAGAAIGKPAELIGEGLLRTGELVGRVADKTGRPFKLLPEAEKFIPFTDLPGVSRARDAIQAGLQTPVGQSLRKVGTAAAEAAGTAAEALGIRKSELQKLFIAAKEAAERGYRRDEKYMREHLTPAIDAASKETGIAREDLEPLWSGLVEHYGRLAEAAGRGDAATIRDIHRDMADLAGATLADKYPAAKVMRAVDEMMGAVEGRQAAGMPAASISASDRGRASPSDLNAGPGLTQRPASQYSVATPPSARGTDRAIRPPRSDGPKISGSRPDGKPFEVGGMDEVSNRIIAQPHNDPVILQAGAEASHDEFKRLLNAATADIPGAQFKASRVKTNTDRIRHKASEGKPIETQGDILGGRIEVDSVSAAQDVIERLERGGRILPGTVENFLDQPRNWGYRAIHAQVKLDNGMTAEVQLLPAEISAAQKQVHSIYKRVREVDLSELDGEAADRFRREVATIEEAFGSGYRAFLERSRRHPPRVVDLGLGGTGAPHSMSYKAGISGSRKEADHYAATQITPAVVGKVRAAVGGGDIRGLDPDTGLPLNADGTVTVYHGTTASAAEAVKKTGALQSAGEPHVYVTTDPAGGGYGDGTVLALKVNPRRLRLDDEFPGGRRDYAIEVDRKSRTAAVGLAEPSSGAGGVPIVYIPIPSTSGAGNEIPHALARKLAAETGGQVIEALTTPVYRRRRAGSKLEAIANPRDFKASDALELPAGARVVLVDDVLRTGGTARDAAAALKAAGVDVAAVVAGKVKKGGAAALRATQGQVDDLIQLAGSGRAMLERRLDRPLTELTGREIATLAEELRRGKPALQLAEELRVARDIPRTAERMAPAIPSTPASREAADGAMLQVYSDLTRDGLIVDTEAMNALHTSDDAVEGLAPGYTFTPEQKGEAEALKNELRARGYQRLVGRVKIRKEGEKAVAGDTGDDAGHVLASQGVRDPISAMADSIIRFEVEGSKQGQIRQAVEWIESNQALATPEQKRLALQYRRLHSDDAATSRAARKAGAAAEVPHEALEVGDQVKIAGEPYRVDEKGPEGITLADGERVRLQPGEPVIADAGSHRPDPIRELVHDSVDRLRSAGTDPTFKRVLHEVRTALGHSAKERNSAIRELLGRAVGSGGPGAAEISPTLALQRAVESHLLTRGLTARGNVRWDSLLERLESIEAGTVGRGERGQKPLTPFESGTHNLGVFAIREADGRSSLTEAGRAALAAMRKTVEAGGDPQQVARLMQDLDLVAARILNHRRTRATVPPALTQRFESIKRILGRMGRTIEDDPAWWSARVSREGAHAPAGEMPPLPGQPAADVARRGPSLPIPQPSELFTPAVAEVVKRVLEFRGKIEARETAAGIASRLTTDRDMGYWPRFLGAAKTVEGKLQRRWGQKWEKAWEEAVRDVEGGKSAGVDIRKTTAENLKAAWARENAARAKAGAQPIAEPDWGAVTEDRAELVAVVGKMLQEAGLTEGTKHQLQRTFIRESMLHEINNLVEATGVAFQTDPVAVWLKRAYASHMGTAGADSLRAVIADMQKTGLAVEVKPIGKVPEGFARINDARFGLLGRGLAFKNEVVAEFNRFTKTADNPHAVLKAFDWATRQFKSLALGAAPYTMTNVLSGVFQANQFDGFSHAAWGGARKFMEDFHAARNLDKPMGSYVKGLPERYAKMNVGEFYDYLAVEHGAIGKGLHGVEMEGAVGDGYRTGWGVWENLRGAFRGADGKRSLAKGLLGISRDPGSMTGVRASLGDQAYFRAFRAANVAVEDWMKTGLIIERLRRGDSIDDALLKGKRAFNQSADMTEFERGVMARLLPFWGWMRGNAVLQFMMAVNRPQMAALVPKIRGNLEASFAGEETLPPSLRPQHVAGELGAQISGGDQPDFFNLTRIFPVKELGTTPAAALNLPRAVMDAAIAGANPLLRMPVEGAINRDLYFDRPINEYEGQRKRFLGIPLSPDQKRYAKLIRPLNVIEQATWRGVPTGPGEAALSTAQQAGVRTFPVDVRRQIFETEQRLNTQLGAVMRDFARARNRAEDAGRDWRTDPEVLRLGELYRALASKKEALPLKGMREANRAALRDSRRERSELKAFALGA